METYMLQREPSTTHGTFGALISPDGKLLADTVELPWINNCPRTSCIPQGEYRCRKYSGTKFKDVWLLEDVPHREDILIHNGNTILDILGCIAVGTGRGTVDTKSGPLPGVLNSRVTLNKLRAQMPSEFILIIEGGYDRETGNQAACKG